jgi:hypothetical protein
MIDYLLGVDLGRWVMCFFLNFGRDGERILREFKENKGT